MRRMALAGIAAPLSFTVLVLLQSLLQPDYPDLVLPISALAAWPYGWIQNLNFFLYGALLIVFAVGLHRGIQGGGRGALGPALLILCGAGAILAGIFPWIRVDGVPTETPGHVAGAVMHFAGGAVGLMVVARRMSGDRAWQPVARYTRWSGILMLALFLTLAAFAIPAQGPLRPWAGLLQRLAVAVWFACILVLALRLRRPSAVAPN